MTRLFPLVRAGEQATWVFRTAKVEVIVVSLQEFVTKKTFKPNDLFYRVIGCGGLHAYLGFNGIIILSLIMRDKIIAGFIPEKYASMINALKPNFWTTVDGETYKGEYKRSEMEIERCFRQTQELIELCSTIPPIGQVKGCSRQQILFHLGLLKSLGVKDFMFHTGDFFRNGDKNNIEIARGYAKLIKDNSRTLILYGLGCPSRFLEFSFADGFITFKHFVAATHGKRIKKNQEKEKCYNRSLVEENFAVLEAAINDIKSQKKLVNGRGEFLWEEALEEVEQFTLQAAVTIATSKHMETQATQA